MDIIKKTEIENPILEEMSAFFNSRSKVYEEKHLEAIDGGIETKNIISSFLPNHTKKLIDLGIGTGLELKEIFKRFPDIEYGWYFVRRYLIPGHTASPLSP